MDGWMDRWIDGWMDGWMDRWMDGWMDRWMDGWMKALPFALCSQHSRDASKNTSGSATDMRKQV